MTTHTIFAALDPALPATLSPVIVPTLLRQRLGFGGVVMTDCMEMKAIADNHPPATSAVLAAQAGVDIVLVSHTRAAQEAAYAGLLEAARNGQIADMDGSLARIATLKERFAVTDAPDVSLIRSAAHLSLMREAARAGMQTVRGKDGVLPLPENAKVALIEFASYHDSEVFDATGHTNFAGLFAARRPDATIIALPQPTPEMDLQKAMAAAREADVTIMATRSAHLNPEQLRAAQMVLDAAQNSILLALRNPYDIGALPEVDAALTTFGGAEPQLEAAVAALTGDFIPEGAAPVELNA